MALGDPRFHHYFPFEAPIDGAGVPNLDVEQAATMFHDMVLWDPLQRNMFALVDEGAGATAVTHSDEAVKLFVAALRK